MIAVIYARYSDDQQNPRSIEDQVRICRAHAQALGAEVREIYADYAVSAWSLKTRPEMRRLLDDARARRFEIVIIEALDRISRDQEDTAGVYKRLVFAGVRLLTVTEGEASPLLIGFKGTMNAVYLLDLAAKVKRGSSGRILAGRSAGGLSYGYRVVRELDGRGELVRGLRAVDPEQANVVRRIFAEYVAGYSPRTIAVRLNAEGVPPPRGRHWNASTINGHAGRGNGILFNPLYVGRLVWNRVSMVKDPETGRRISRVNPAAQQILVEAPELRIVDDAVWQAAQARKAAYGGLRPEQQRRPRHLLSGLLRCACCGGSYVAKGKNLLGCSRYAETGTCTNGGSVKRGHVEGRVLEGIRATLLDPGFIGDALKAYHEERQRLAGDRRQRRRDLERRLPRVRLEIERLVDRICDGSDDPASTARLKALDGRGGERERLEAELEALAADDKLVELHPGAIEAYTRAVTALRESLEAGASHAAEAVALLRGLVDRIEIRPAGKGRPPGITLYGRLAELLADPIRVLGPVQKSATAVAGDRLRRFRPEIPIAC